MTHEISLLTNGRFGYECVLKVHIVGNVCVYIVPCVLLNVRLFDLVTVANSSRGQ